MRSTVGLMIWAAILISNIAHAGPATTQAGPPEIDRLIQELSDDRWPVRQKAQDRLVELADQAEPQIKILIEQTEDPNLRTIAQSILARIADEQQSGPTRITLHCDNTSPREIVAELARQSGAELPVWPANMWEHHESAPVTLHLDRQPFWVVMRELCQKANLRVQTMGGESTMTLMKGHDQQFQGPVAYSGPFMIVAVSSNLSRRIQLDQPEVINISRGIQFMVYAEPKLRVLGRTEGPRIVELRDGEGNALELPPQGPFDVDHQASEPIWGTSISVPDRPELRKLGKLKAELGVMIATETDTLEIDDVLAAKDVERVVGGHRIVLAGVQEQAAQYLVKVTVYPSQIHQNGNRILDYLYDSVRQIRLVDDRGRSLNRRGSSGIGGDRKIEYELRFARAEEGGDETAPRKPAKLLWEVPSAAEVVNVPFEFTDLPLP